MTDLPKSQIEKLSKQEKFQFLIDNSLEFTLQQGTLSRFYKRYDINKNKYEHCVVGHYITTSYQLDMEHWSVLRLNVYSALYNDIKQDLLIDIKNDLGIDLAWNCKVNVFYDMQLINNKHVKHCWNNNLSLDNADVLNSFENDMLILKEKYIKLIE